MSRMLAPAPLRALWWAAGTLILASFALPSTREMHVLTFRLLFHLQGDRTFVQGQPPGCVITIVPEVSFVRQYHDRLVHDAGTSPAAFLKVSCVSNEAEAFPPVETWRGHPLVTWAAVQGATKVWHWTPPPTQTSSAPTQSAKGTPDDYVAHVMDTIHYAQQLEPDNGLLWLAEAWVRLDRGFEAEGVQAVETASAKPYWDANEAQAFDYLCDLLRAEGLPQFDAVNAARWRLSFMGTETTLIMKITEHLFDIMAREIRARNDDEVYRLVAALDALGTKMGLERAKGCRLYDRCQTDVRLIEAMAERLGRTLPADSGDSYQRRRAAMIETFDAYMDRHVSRELRHRMSHEDRHQQDAMIAWCNAFGGREKRIFSGALLASEGGRLSLLLMSFFMAVLAVELSFLRLDRRVSTGIHEPWWHWLLPIALGCAGATWVLFSSADSLLQPVGLRGNCVEPALTPSQENLLLAAFMGFAFTCLRLVALRYHCQHWFRAVLLVTLPLYLIPIGVAAYWRNEVIDLVTAICTRW